MQFLSHYHSYSLPICPARLNIFLYSMLLLFFITEKKQHTSATKTKIRKIKPAKTLAMQRNTFVDPDTLIHKDVREKKLFIHYTYTIITVIVIYIKIETKK